MPTLKILTQNVKMLSGPGGEERGEQIVKAIKKNKYDLVCLQEVFDEDIREIFVTGLKPSLPYQVEKCSDHDVFNDDSGLFFASKHPIKGSYYEEFEECRGTDCLADKGIFGARLSVSDKNVDHTLVMFNNHLQSDEQHQETRGYQIRQLRKCIETTFRRIGERPFIALVCGDMNVIGDYHPEYRQMISLLGYPRDLFRDANPKEVGYTWNGDENTNMIPSSDKDKQRLDYILAYDKVPDIEDKGRELIKVKCTKAMVQMFDTTKDNRLSDHFGVEAVVGW